MVLAVLLGFASGTFAANATPHFVKGITGERFPTPFGGSPVINVVAGWAMYAGAVVLAVASRPGSHPLAVGAAAALGVLGMALFHATVGAFGRAD